MAEELTHEQKQAVDHRGGRLLVSAAAGSGKTKVLVDRLMGYLTDPVAPANIDDFLIITFTKAAAAELRGKIAAKLSQRISETPDSRHLQQQLQRLYLAKISTVHAFCGDILREYAYQLDISADFRVADENEARQLRTQTLEKVLENAYNSAYNDRAFCAFVDTQDLGRSDTQIGDLVLRVYDSAQCHLDPGQWLQECTEMTQAEDGLDASDTKYGRFLMEQLFSWLDLQIRALESCLQRAAGMEGFDKPCALLADTVYQLRHLRSATTWDEIIDRKNVDFGTLRFPKNCDEALEERIKILRESCKKNLPGQLQPFTTNSAKVLEELASVADAMQGLIGLVNTFDKAYAQAKRSRQVLDFGDLEHKTLDLLLGKSRSGLTQAVQELGSRFREVMVDEYQDSNAVQDAIYDALTRKRGNLFMVGDVKQSIYQFRLADPGIFLDKYDHFVPAEEASAGQDTKVLLSRNFRSGGGVLAAANDVFRLCMSREVGGLYYTDAEALHEGLEHTPLMEPETELYCIQVREHTYPEEAEFTAQRIAQLLDGSHFVRDEKQLRPIRPEDIVILLRAPGSSGKYYQKALEARGIRCSSGGGTDLLKEPEIATFRSILQVVHNPMLDIPLIAAMASPAFGFTADELARIRSRDKKCAFYDSLRQDDSPRTAAFLETLLQLRQARKRNSLTGILQQVLLKTNLDGIYGAMADGENRLRNLQTFYQLAAQQESGGSRDLGRFLEHLEAMEEKGLLTAGDQAAAGTVSIMSIHKSKGLEFPVVFLCGLARSFNMESKREKVLCHKDLGLGLSAADAKKRIHYPTIAKRAISQRIGMDAVSEEMRILYVAMTRAKDRLIMTYASKHLEKKLMELTSLMDMGANQLLIRQANCSGDWVLMTALNRTEAGELFAIGGKPQETTPGTPAWKIAVAEAGQAGEALAQSREQKALPAGAADALRQNLRFRYPHLAATTAPSKQTATQRKGRDKDQEAAQDAAVQRRPRSVRKPSFVEAQPQATAYGTATHAALQYIDYSRCTDAASVRQELRRLVTEGYITPEQGSLVRPDKIAAFFATDLGKKLIHSKHVQREFKFSILEDGQGYDPELTQEQVLLQGVVDCALVEDDGITIVDFKTDYVTEETITAVAQRYAPQVRAYAGAMSRIFQQKIKRSVLYFFRLDRFVEIG